MFIAIVIVDQPMHSILKVQEQDQWSFIVITETSGRYFVSIFTIEASSIDKWEQVEHQDDDDSEINGAIAKEISIGQQLMPVDRRR